MDEQQVQGLHRQAGHLADFPDRLGHQGHGGAEDLLAGHDGEGVAGVDLLMRHEGTALEAGAQHGQHAGSGAVRVEADGAEARLAIAAFDDHGTGPVAEEDRPVPGGGVLGPLGGRDLPCRSANEGVPAQVPGHEGRVHLRPHQQHPPVAATLDEQVREFQAVEEAAALLPDVESGDVPQAQGDLEQGAVARQHVIRGHGGEDDGIDVPGRQTRIGDGVAGRHHAEIRRTLPCVSVAPLLDTAANADPLVRGVHEARQGLVRDDMPRQADAGSGDDASHGHLSLTFGKDSRGGGRGPKNCLREGGGNDDDPVLFSAGPVTIFGAAFGEGDPGGLRSEPSPRVARRRESHV